MKHSKTNSAGVAASVNPRISVLVRVKNEAPALPRFLESLAQQTLIHDTEVVFLDSGSTDGTVSLIRSSGYDVHELSGKFNFGRSCNQIAGLSKGTILVYLSGHVILSRRDSLEIVAQLLEKHPRGAAFFRQVPNGETGSNAYERAFLKHRFPRGDSTIRMRHPGGFSNAASAVTRKSWMEQPFPELHGSEDFAWAAKHLDSGGELFYLPQVEVMHSHNESAAEVYRRVRINAEARGETGHYLKVAAKLVGVYCAIVLSGGGASEASSYARAHARAYL